MKNDFFCKYHAALQPLFHSCISFSLHTNTMKNTCKETKYDQQKIISQARNTASREEMRHLVESIK